MQILLTGFFGENNLGDEAIRQAIIEHIPKDCRCVVTSGKPMIIGGKSIIRRGIASWPHFLQASAQSDLAIFSGGILQDWSFEGVIFFALRIMAARMLNCEPALWGAGIGSLKKSGTRNIAKRSLIRVKTAWLRDKTSCELFSELMGRSALRGTDWSWYFPVEFQAETGQNAAMGLNLRSWPYNTAWQSLIDKQLKNVDRRVFGMAARNGDITAIRQIAPESTIVQPENFIEFAMACRNVSYGVAMRYHAVLAMLRAGIPIKVIDYDNKVTELAQEAKILTLSENQVNDFRKTDSKFLKAHEKRFFQMQSAFKEWIEKSRRLKKC